MPLLQSQKNPFEMWTHVISYLNLQWSPEQIASRVSVSVHSIYRFIRQDKTKAMHFEIEQRTRFGDLEIDTIVGKNHQQSLVSILDQKTGYLWLKKCRSRKAEDSYSST